ncbi:terpene synthase family protein [Streptomyces sp. NBC_00237]|uniref:terpene synthase family protein n=1 Tax=Streptomyces sp. NBC_00237 TaxID=2975687 RepID=UPI00224D7775|nr:terpene synthase family protein [Streptomyces sp. NBC_00237]MCX5206211.1 terpene synthase family protein [Streptomyces sp. NBC_00237]
MTRRIYCPVPPAAHPEAARIDSQITPWVAQSGMCPLPEHRDKIARTLPAQLTGQILPRAPADRLTLVTRFFVWLFAFDDRHYDDVGTPPDPALITAICARLVRGLDSRTLPRDATAFESSLYEITEHLAVLASTAQLQRWSTAMRGYLSSLVGKAANRYEHITPSLDAYALMRIHSGAVMTTVTLLDVGGGYEVPEADFRLPSVRALTEMCSLLVGWDNDLLSRGKEQQTADRQNLVDVIACEHRIGVAEALDEAITTRNLVLAQFLLLRDRVAPQVNDATRDFLAALSQWIRANLDWSLRTGRYQLSGPVADLVERPPEGDSVRIHPADLASIGCWWQGSSALGAQPAPLGFVQEATNMTAAG